MCIEKYRARFLLQKQNHLSMTILWCVINNKICILSFSNFAGHGRTARGLQTSRGHSGSMRNYRHIERATASSILGCAAVKTPRKIAQLAIGAGPTAAIDKAGHARCNCQRAGEVCAQRYCTVDWQFGEARERQADSWMLQVLKFVFDFCGSNDPQQSEIGTAIFATLTATAPDQFVPHIGSVCQMFSAALVATESSGNMATPVILNILQGMSNLVPFILGHNNAEETYQKAIPYVVKALSCFAVQDADNFIKAFDILENLADYAPKLLNGSLKVLIDFCLEVSNNFNIDDTVRVRACSYIGWLIRIKKKSILKQKLVEPILQVIFNLMATAPENEDDEDDEEYYAEDTSPKTTATQTMDQLAVYIPSERLIPPLLTLLDPALKGNNPLHKKAAYLCIAVIAEGCSDAICSKYLRILLDVVKIGITDPNPVVSGGGIATRPHIELTSNLLLYILITFPGTQRRILCVRAILGILAARS